MKNTYQPLAFIVLGAVIALVAMAEVAAEDTTVVVTEDSSAGNRHDYPTIETVGYVLECMQENGGQTVENMYSCSCRFDKLAATMSFDDYERRGHLQALSEDARRERWNVQRER